MLFLRRCFANRFTSGVCSLIGPGKKKGEDAYFTSPDLLSIADGVGGWTLSGIDPSKYAWQLMKNVESFSASLVSDRTGFNILSKAAAKCTETGSSTCCLLLLNQSSATIDALNVGDSGFFLYRKENNGLALVEKSQEVLHGFNFPFQLGTDGDSVATAWKKTVQVKDKDILIVYTDGLSDNLFENAIREIVKNELDSGSELRIVAEKLANTAIDCSVNENYLSPFAKAASVAYKQRYIGGKPDDTTVIVAEIRIE
jgi:protein phosphatase PTC7